MSIESFQDALAVWAQDALRIATVPDVELIERYVWIDEGNGRGSRIYSPRVFWSYEFRRKTSQIATWEGVDREAGTWPRLMEHDQTLVGSDSTGAIRMTLADFTHRFVPQPYYSEGSIVLPTFVPTAFASTFESLQRFVESQEIQYEYRTILFGLEAEDGAHPCVLFDNASIDKLTSQEIQELGEEGLIPAQPIAFRDLYDWEGTPRFILRWTRSFPKRLGAELDGAAGLRSSQEFESVIEHLIIALALASPGEVIRGGTDFRSESWTFGGRSSMMAASPLRFDRSRDMRLSRADCALVRALFAKIHEEPRTMEGSLGIALRRLSYGMERRRVEDRFLDDMIAAEALFVDDSSKTEVQYRLALRAAFALEPTDRHARRRVFDNMKAAYAVRSAIAHGSAPKEKALVIDGEKVPLPRFVDAVESYIRKALQIAVERFGEQFLPEKWDDYIVGEKA